MPHTNRETWRRIVASALDWREAHATFDDAVAGLPAALRGKRPARFPHSSWELVEHIRLAQADLLEFMTNREYSAPTWPADYWPSSPEPRSARAWNESLRAVREDAKRLQRLTTKKGLDLTAKIPWGNGQTYLRTILVAIDHTSYHVGQIIVVRRLLGMWPPA